MSLPRLWAFLAVALPAIAALIASLQSVDLTYHLRAGGEILDSRAIPTVDTWTFTAAGVPWVDQQWGAQVILAAIYRLGGWTGLVFFRALLVGLIFGCLFAVGRRRGLDARLAAWLTLAAFVVSAAALSLRPQLLGMALFALVLYLVVDRHIHPRRLWAIPVIVLAWANLHGSFFLAPVVLGLAWLEDLHDRAPQPHRVLAVAAAAAAAACITPFGPAVWAYAIGLSMNPEVTRRITEWQPTSLRDVPGLLFFGSLAAVVVLLARHGQPVSWPTLAWLGVFAALGAYAARGIAWWPLGAVVGVAGLLAVDSPERSTRPQPRDKPELRRLNAAVAAIVVIAGVAASPIWRPIDPGTGAPNGLVANAPSGITAALRDLAQPGDRVLNPQAWGSWFEFAIPDVLVAIDSRIEFFPLEVWDAYDVAMSGTDPEATQIRAWDVTIAVLAAPDRRLLGRLGDLGWRTVYQDDDGQVMTSPDR